MNLWSTLLELDKINEDIYDIKPARLNNWVTANGQQVKLNNVSPSTPNQVSQPVKPAITSASGKCVVVIVSDKGRLRAFGTDGVNPAAFVAFPNSLRQFEGQKYEVDQLIWNGKNYRVSGNIREIKNMPPLTATNSNSAQNTPNQNSSTSNISASLKLWLEFMKDAGLPGDLWYDYDLGDDDKVPLIIDDKDLLSDLAIRVEAALKNLGLLSSFGTTDPDELFEDDEDNALDIIDVIAGEIVELLGL
jgi:hypothetical protein